MVKAQIPRRSNVVRAPLIPSYSPYSPIDGSDRRRKLTLGEGPMPSVANSLYRRRRVMEPPCRASHDINSGSTTSEIPSFPVPTHWTSCNQPQALHPIPGDGFGQSSLCSKRRSSLDEDSIRSVDKFYASEGWDWHEMVDEEYMLLEGEWGLPVWVDPEEEMIVDNANVEENNPKLTRSHRFVSNLQELSGSY